MSNLSPDTAVAVLQASQLDTSKAASNLKKAQAENNIEKIEQAAEEFEAVFITEMLKPMFEGLETDGPFGGGKGEEVFRGFMLEEYGKLLTKSGGIGIADQVKTEMIRLQEQVQKGVPENDS